MCSLYLQSTSYTSTYVGNGYVEDTCYYSIKCIVVSHIHTYSNKYKESPGFRHVWGKCNTRTETDIIYVSMFFKTRSNSTSMCITVVASFNIWIKIQWCAIQSSHCVLTAYKWSEHFESTWLDSYNYIWRDRWRRYLHLKKHPSASSRQLQSASLLDE